jgi:hypothetical protein
LDVPQAPEATEKVQASVAEIVARYAADLRYEDLPDDVVWSATRAILDTFGCALGGYTAEPSKIAFKLASNVSAQQPATVLFTGTKTAPDLAVFANGVMIRYLDFNDAFVSQTKGAGHPSDMIAALLTAAEVRQRSGRDLIAATVLAYEVFCKIADLLGNANFELKTGPTGGSINVLIAPAIIAPVNAASSARAHLDLAGSTARDPLAPYEGLIRAFEPCRRSARLSVKKCPREQLWKCAQCRLVGRQSAKCISCAN